MSGTETRSRGNGWKFEDEERSKEGADQDQDSYGDNDDLWSPASDTALLSSPRSPILSRAGRVRKTSVWLACASLVTIVLALSSNTPFSIPILNKNGREALIRGNISLASIGTDSPSSRPHQFQQFQPACTPLDWSNGTWIPLDPPLSPWATIWDASPDFHNHGCAQNWHRGEWYLGLVPPGSQPGPISSPENAVGPQGEWPMSKYRRQAAGWVWEPATEVCDEEVELPWYEMSEVAGTSGEEDEGTVRLLQDLIDRGGWLILGGMFSFFLIERNALTLSVLETAIVGQTPSPKVTSCPSPAPFSLTSAPSGPTRPCPNGDRSRRNISCSRARAHSSPRASSSFRTIGTGTARRSSRMSGRPVVSAVDLRCTMHSLKGPPFFAFAAGPITASPLSSSCEPTKTCTPLRPTRPRALWNSSRPPRAPTSNHSSPTSRRFPPRSTTCSSCFCALPVRATSRLKFLPLMALRRLLRMRSNSSAERPNRRGTGP